MLLRFVQDAGGGMSAAQGNHRDVRVGVHVAEFAGHSSRSAVFLIHLEALGLKNSRAGAVQMKER
jgi:hypothetical protein